MDQAQPIQLSNLDRLFWEAGAREALEMLRAVISGVDSGLRREEAQTRINAADVLLRAARGG